MPTPPPTALLQLSKTRIMRYFFFGTLMDIDALELVFGHRVEIDRLRPACLDGYLRRVSMEESYPVLVPAPGAVVEGMLLDDVTTAEAARVSFFEETEYETDLVTVTTTDGKRAQAHCHISSTMDAYRNTPWELGEWQATEKATFMILARRWMEFFESGNNVEADEEWDRIKAEIESGQNTPATLNRKN